MTGRDLACMVVAMDLSGILPINAPTPVPPPLYPGDPAPWFVAPSNAVPRFEFSTLGGRRVLMTFVESLRAQEAIVSGFLAAMPQLRATRTGLIVVTADPTDMTAAPPEGLPVRYIYDPERAVSRLYGVAADDGAFRQTSFLIDESLRLFGVVPARAGQAYVATVLAAHEKMGPLAPVRRALAQAPVLIIPNVFEPALCRRLISGYEAHGGVESGFMVERGDHTVEEHDFSHKRRADWRIDDPVLREDCRVRLSRRVAPEIQRAFQFEASRLERYLVACYGADVSGHFAAHRDNRTRATAHRRFAVSLNLNDDYEGGELMFAEFGRHRFRPPAGGACVFSCSLLHEATIVTKGRRYVFVPFVYDERAQTVRDDNSHYLAKA